MLAQLVICMMVQAQREQIHPMVDSSLFARVEGATFRTQHPRRLGTAFHFDAPWEGIESGYATVVPTDKGWRMYYKAGGEGTREYTCVSESPNGRKWIKLSAPSETAASSAPKGSNVVWTGIEAGYAESHNFMPFYDPRPECPPNERWKAVGLGRDGSGANRRKALVALASSDGIEWRRLLGPPLFAEGGLDSLNVAFYDTNKRLFVCYFRDAKSGLRWVKRKESKDFKVWSESTWLQFPSLSSTQFYTNGIQPYPGVPGLYMAMPMRFIPTRKEVGFPPIRVDGVSDGLLLFSRDGITFDSPSEPAWILPGNDQANWGNAHANNTPVTGIAAKPDEWIVYWMDGYGSLPRVSMGSLRPHGFIALSFPSTGGSALSRPLRFGKGTLKANFTSSAAGSLQFEIRRTNGEPVPGFTFEDCEPFFGDFLAREIRWERGGIESLENMVALLAVRGAEADLFSLSITSAAP